jgi:autotransporter-associated beta strand protein
MQFNALLRAWIDRSFSEKMTVIRRSLRRNPIRQVEEEIRPGIEALETRTLLSTTPLYWNPQAAAANSSLTWDTTTPEWNSGGPTGTLVAWNNTDPSGPFVAVFATGSGTVNLAGPIIAAGLNITTTSLTLAPGPAGGSIVLPSSGGSVSVGSGVGSSVIATISATISGGPLTKLSAGTLILTGSNSYSGTTGTVVSGGTLQIGNGAATGTLGSGAVSLSAGTSLTLDRSDSPTFANNIFLSIGSETINVVGGATLSGVISGTGAVNIGAPISGGGVTDDSSLTLGSSNTYTGSTTVSSGNLDVVGAAALDSSTVSVAAGATLDATAGSLLSVTSLNDDGAITLADPISMLPVVGQPVVLSGSGTLTIFGGGLTITGTDTYTGTTVLQMGGLSLQNANAGGTAVGTGLGSVTVAANSILDGTGGTSGAVTVNNGGVLDPGIGTSTSTLSTGSVSLSSGSDFNVALDSSVVSTGYDQLDVNGTVTLGNSTLNLSGTRTSHDGDQLEIINNEGTGPINGTFAGLPNNSIVPVNGVNYTLSYFGGTGNDVVLTDASPPVAVSYNYNALENVPLTATAPLGILSNDTNYGGILSVYSVNGSTSSVNQPIATGNGTLTLNLDGSFTYVPQVDFIGTDNVTYVVTDGTAESTPETISFIVAASAPTITSILTPSPTEADLSWTSAVNYDHFIVEQSTDPSFNDDDTIDFGLKHYHPWRRLDLRRCRFDRGQPFDLFWIKLERQHL